MDTRGTKRDCSECCNTCPRIGWKGQAKQARAKRSRSCFNLLTADRSIAMVQVGIEQVRRFRASGRQAFKRSRRVFRTQRAG